jgi:hypothetical protein
MRIFNIYRALDAWRNNVPGAIYSDEGDDDPWAEPFINAANIVRPPGPTPNHNVQLYWSPYPGVGPYFH